MDVRLVGMTVPTNGENPTDLSAQAAAICTNSDNPYRALRGAMKSGHESVL